MMGMHTPEKHRWYCPTPSWLVLGSMAVTGLLFLSEKAKWFPSNDHKGWTVLIAVAGLGVVLIAMLVWWVIALIFRRRFQFGTRTLLLVVVIVALPFSWLAAEMKKARQQHQTALAIAEAGGHVYYDYECDESDLLIASAQPACPKWSLDGLGRDFFAKIVQAAVEGDAGLEHATDLQDLKCLLVGSYKAPRVRGAPPVSLPLVLSGGTYEYGGYVPREPVNGGRLCFGVKVTQLKSWFDFPEPELERLKSIPEDRDLWIRRWENAGPKPPRHHAGNHGTIGTSSTSSHRRWVVSRAEDHSLAPLVYKAHVVATWLCSPSCCRRCRGSLN